jgi:hypothetical protein
VLNTSLLSADYEGQHDCQCPASACHGDYTARSSNAWCSSIGEDQQSSTDGVLDGTDISITGQISAECRSKEGDGSGAVVSGHTSGTLESTHREAGLLRCRGVTPVHLLWK